MVATPVLKGIYNVKVIVAPTAGTDITIYQGRGVDTASEIYLNFESEFRKIILSSNVGFLITEMAGKVLDYPIKIHADKPFIDPRIAHYFFPFKVHTLTTTTYIKVIGGGY